MTITEQIRLKLKMVDEELAMNHRVLSLIDIRGMDGARIIGAKEATIRARRILREICELDEESEE